jgi:hypothetical protein
VERFDALEQPQALLILGLLLLVCLALMFATTIAAHAIRWRTSRLPERLSERLLEEWLAELRGLNRARQLTFALGALLTRRRLLEMAFDPDAPHRPEVHRARPILKWVAFFASLVALDYVLMIVRSFMPGWMRAPSMILALVLGAIAIHRSHRPLTSLDLNERDSRVE